MSITETIPSLGTVPTTAEPASFDTRADTLLGTALPAFRDSINTFAGQANILAASMNSVAAGGTAIPYTFSTTTADADPGAGLLRLGSATQNAATVIRSDLVGSDGTTWTDLIDSFDDSTSTVKGQIILMNAADATKWLVFNLASIASPTGYKNITVENVASSTAAPFSNGDSILLKFTRTGDKGQSGSGGLVPISGGIVSNQASGSISIPSGYGEYVLKIRRAAVATNGAYLQMRTSTNAGSSFDSGSTDYSYICGRLKNGNGTGTGSTGDSKIVLTADQVNTTSGEYSGTLHIVLPADSLKTQIYGFGGYEQVGAPTATIHNAHRLSTADVDAIQIFADTGNVSFQWELLGVAAP